VPSRYLTAYVPRDGPHAFPTRRSSDLVASSGWGGRIETRVDSPAGPLISTANVPFTAGAYTNITAPLSDPQGTHTLCFVFLRNRSEEHTSELQSLRHLVCRLLLEKKKH